MTSRGVQAPVEESPGPEWEHLEVWRRVQEAIRALPLYFRSETVISGLSATDIFTLGGALGATIEENVVITLNEMRPVWDPAGNYRLYGFLRQPQTFPDVVLKRRGKHDEFPDIILGVELKGWYALAKEGEPSFRFTVTRDACAEQDLLVVVPWALSNVISGSPQVFTPFVVLARYAAEYRNYHWQHIRRTRSDTSITIPQGVGPYPAKADQIADKPVADGGGNFGRIARTGIMDAYMQEIMRLELRGIEVSHWISFFKLFQEQGTEEDVKEGIEKLGSLVEQKRMGEDKRARVMTILEQLEGLIT